MDEKMELVEEHRGIYALNQSLQALKLSLKAPTITGTTLTESVRAGTQLSQGEDR